MEVEYDNPVITSENYITIESFNSTILRINLKKINHYRHHFIYLLKEMCE